MKTRMLQLLENLAPFQTFQQNLIEVRTLPPKNYNEHQWQIVTALLELLPVLVAHLQVLFQEQSVVDYTEVALSAVKALGPVQDPTDLALRLDYQIQHILLDEFQDTSVAQLRLLEQLTAGWQANENRTLFLVGDPMQSIYRFRKAEVGLFLHVREHGVGAIHLEPLTLRVNFRSAPLLIDWFNTTFQPLLPEQEDIASGAVPFTPSIAGAPADPTAAIAFHVHCNIDNAQEAQSLAALIQAIQNSDPNQRIAILVRARTHLLDTLPALQAANIPYRAIEIEALSERVIIRDLSALTRALLHPADRIAWLAVLRAPWCGLTLADLLILVGPMPFEPLWNRIQRYHTLPLSVSAQQRLQRIHSVLNQSLQHRGRQSLALWIEGTWQALGGPACLAAASELNDAQAFFKLLQTLENDTHLVNMLDLDEKLAQLYANPTTDAVNPVEIMTIHKAKGLEFDTVILPELDRPLPSDDPQLLLYLERPNQLGGADLLLAPIKATADEKDPIYEYLRLEEKKRADFETARLLYVAATRAKKSLHLIASLHRDETSNEIKKPAKNSLLAKLWPTLGKQFLKNIKNEAAQTGEAVISSNPAHHTLQRLTDNWQLPMTAQGILPEFNNVSTSKYRARPIQFTGQIDTARHIGIVIHRFLEQIAREGIEQWPAESISTRRQHIYTVLTQSGIPKDQLANAGLKVETALNQMLSEPRGRWILDHRHGEAACEYPLTTVIEDQAIQVIIDRTFIDEHGVRWIIDYKTGEDTNINTYREQLEKYAKIMQNLKPEPIHLGLYFPLSGIWHEWEFISRNH